MNSTGEDPRFLIVGHMNKPHGTRGEIFVWSLTDYPDSHFRPGARHLVGDDQGSQPSPDEDPLVVETVRPFRKGFLVRFEGVGDRGAARDISGRYLFRPFDDIDQAQEGEYFYHELLGSLVQTREGEALGEVREVYALKPSDLLRVVGEKGEVLIPLIRQYVVEVYRKGRRIVVDVPEGLLP